jgi:putative ABC transport system substrate-binding protein
MKRREFIRMVGGAAATWPLAARAYTTEKAPKRIAFFPDLPLRILDEWRADMRVLGWIDERDYVVMQSGFEPGSPSPLNEAAQRLVANQPDLICTRADSFALAAQRATGSIPIVMLVSGYPVEAGLADSLAKPGRNVTGNSMYAEMGVWGKMLQLLREVNPAIKRVGFLATYLPPAFPKEEIEIGNAEINSAARTLELDIRFFEVASSDQVRTVLAEIDEWKPEGLQLTSGFLSKLVTQFAVDKKLLTVADWDWTPAVSPHPLLCYAPPYRELVQSAAASIDKIWRGANPSELPIQRPRRFELIVSLKTANAIGLTLPAAVLALADRVIE